MKKKMRYSIIVAAFSEYFYSFSLLYSVSTHSSRNYGQNYQGSISTLLTKVDEMVENSRCQNKWEWVPFGSGSVNVYVGGDGWGYVGMFS